MKSTTEYKYSSMGIAVAIAALAVGYFPRAAHAGGACNSSACTYFSDGTTTEGTCAAIYDELNDIEYCGCVVNGNMQMQVACNS
jgi:hypothetical protein